MLEDITSIQCNEECSDNYSKSSYSIFRGVCTYKKGNIEVAKHATCVYELSFLKKESIK